MKLFILFWCLSAFVHLATSRHNNNNNNNRNDNNHNNNNNRNENNHNNNNNRNDNNHNNYHSNSPYCQKKCPLFNDPLSGVLHLPGPTKTHFYKCDHGIGIMFVCPSKTHFNPKLQICDWPNRADAVTCQDSPNHIPEGSGDEVWEGIAP